jgi:nicotinamidase-related amidase
MPTRNKNLHGNVPHKSPVALSLLDVINDLDFEGNESLLKHARTVANRIASLKERAARAGITSIYVNDNFTLFSSPGIRDSIPLRRTRCSVIWKRTLIRTGIAGDRCVLFTANDACLREYRIIVPADCVVSNEPRQNRQALERMEQVLKADIRPPARLNLLRLKITPR